MKTMFSTLVFGGVLFVSGALQAHHSFLSQYDPDTSHTVEGEVTEIWFQNPHSRAYVEVPGDSGEPILRETETYPRNIPVRRGWKHDANRLQILTIVRPSDVWEGVGYLPSSID